MISRDMHQIRQQYVRDRYIFIPGAEMRYFLREFGADLGDLKAMQKAWNDLPADPTLEFRKSRNGRFSIDYIRKSIKRLENKGFRLSPDEDFVRHDSGTIRKFAPILHDIQKNSIFCALLRFKSLLIRNVDVKSRANLKLGKETLVSTVFALRTITGDGLIGEPAAEGVHTDGVEHTMTTLIGCANMSADSAFTTIHYYDERTGIHTSEANKFYVATRVRQANPLDTLLIVDSERKHSLTKVSQMDDKALATRDMLIFFTRPCFAPEHVNYGFETLAPSRDMPLEISFCTQTAGL